jgi:hypothetical protein
MLPSSFKKSKNYFVRRTDLNRVRIFAENTIILLEKAGFFMRPRTDLAVELNELRTGSSDKSGELSGPSPIPRFLREGFNVTFMEILNEEGEVKSAKKGEICDHQSDGTDQQGRRGLFAVASALAGEIMSLCPDIKKKTILVAGLGNAESRPMPLGRPPLKT